MNGTIVNYRRGRHRVTVNQMIVLPEGVESKENTSTVIGKVVVWTSPAGKEIKGKVSQAHGRKGAVRTIFEKGMPGQAIGTKVSIQ